MCGAWYGGRDRSGQHGAAFEKGWEVNTRRGALAVLAAAQFLMVLDAAVMNVSISRLVEDFSTEVTTIQGIITFYALVMAALMVVGGRLGDRYGRRRVFAIGMAVYAGGSALTAVAWSVPVLALGWAVLEGIGAALVLPALVALVAGNYQGRERAFAYAVIGGVAGIGVAVGPILGGWVTETLTWRIVFVGEVVVAIAILASLRLVADAPPDGPAPRLDGVGAVLLSSSLSLIVFGVLQASTWGWLRPRSSPIEPFGFSLTPFVVVAGLLLLWAFVGWQRHREEHGDEPLVRLELLQIDALRSGLGMFLLQNLVLMGVFFTLPLYLQIVMGLDAFETGVRMLPVSIAMLVSSLSGPMLAARGSPRTVVRVGLIVLLAAVLLLLATVGPELRGVGFGVALAVLGVGMGLIASQLANVVQSAVGADDRAAAGGLQYTAQQLGAALGTALVGAIVVSGLAGAFQSRIAADERIPAPVLEEATIRLAAGVDFVDTDAARQAAAETGLAPDVVDALVDGYGDAQLIALKAGLLVAALLVVAAFPVTRGLPATADSQHSERDGVGPAT
jgi:EmrB/QacA subfamily drug resistance transporter